MVSPTDRRYTNDHGWLLVVDAQAKRARVGLTDHAQRQLGEMVYVERPEVGATFDRGDAFGSVESVKAVSELFMPVSGKITQVNPALDDDPETINRDPLGTGWLIELTMFNPAEVDELLNATQYDELLREEDS